MGPSDKKFKSSAFESIHESAAALHEVGAIDDSTMREYDGSCLASCPSTPPAPQGYPSWLDYAVATMDTRSAALEYLFTANEGAWTREQMAQAVRDELAQLRCLAAGGAKR